jgi:UDP-N-acetyl-D-glucosamine dehydrogenase
MSDSLPPSAATLLHAIEARTARVGVIGLGYAGLPLAEVFVRAGFRVVGHDIDPARIESLRQGKSYIGHFGPEQVQGLLAGGRFRPTEDPGDLTALDIVLICVPTPLTEAREPDLSAVRGATASVARVLSRQAPMLVVLTSTTYPGTTRDVVGPILEATGLSAGCDFFLAYSPEREDPGNRQYGTANIPRVVGGADPASARLAQTLFAAVLTQIVPVSSMEVAEAAKILENTYRAVNIALVNELKILYEQAGIDVWEVIEAAKTKPFGFQPFYPGPGWGGHCIPVDPFYLAWLGRKVDQPARFVELAGEINTSMPQYVAARVADALNERGKPVKGSHIALVGMAYKRDVDDVRESPGLVLLQMLRQKGAVVSYNDPHVPQLPTALTHGLWPGLPLESQPLTAGYLQTQDCVLIVTDHSAYDWDWIVTHANLVVDTRNATRNVARHRERIRKA